MRHIALILIPVLSGCAGMLSQNKDTISISTEPTASIYIDEKLVGNGNVVVEVNRTQNFEVTTISECGKKIIYLEREVDPNILWNILIDFGIGTIPMELLSGTGWKYKRNNAIHPC
ncbi:hypothetical protein F7U66_00665 [Vibrio parahaemolyticus]|nr:hypothetical protein [Vibrio parahaemolyticus]